MGFVRLRGTPYLLFSKVGRDDGEGSALSTAAVAAAAAEGTKQFGRNARVI